MERTLQLESDQDVFLDLKYFEDPADGFREGEGTLLPLWRLQSEAAKKKQVVRQASDAIHK